MSANTLHIQQYVSEAVNGADPGSWQTIDIQATDDTVCPDVDLDAGDVGDGTFRLRLTDSCGDVLDTSREVVL